MKLVGLAHLRFLLATRWSTAAVIVGISIGVTSVVGVHLISERISASLQVAQPTYLTAFSHLYFPKEPPAGVGDDSGDDPASISASGGAPSYFELRRHWRASNLQEVQALVPFVEGAVVYQRRLQGESQASQVAVVGADLVALLAVSQALEPRDDLIPRTSGQFSAPQNGGALVSADLGLAVGDTFTIGGVALVVSQVMPDTRSSLFVDIGYAQEILALDPNQVHFVGARVADRYSTPRRWLEQLMPGISAGLPEVAAPQLHRQWQGRNIAAELVTQQFGQSVLFNLGALGLLAILVAWFLILQVAVVWLNRLLPTYQRLHQLGLTAAELRRYFMVSLLLLGSVATLIGLAGGWFLANGLMNGLMNTNPNPETAAFQASVLTQAAVLKAVVTGIGVSWLGAWIAIRQVLLPRKINNLAVAIRLGLFFALGLIGLLLPASGLVGGFLSILGFCLFVVGLVPTLLRFLHKRLIVVRPLLIRSSFREVTSQGQVFSIAIGALVLAIATSIGVGSMVASFRIGFTEMLDLRLSHDLVIESQSGGLEQLRDELLATGQVSDALLSGTSNLRLQGYSVALQFGKFLAPATMRYGYPQPLRRGDVMISENLAAELNLSVGDTLPVGGERLNIAHIFPGYGEVSYRVVIDEASARKLGASTTYSRLALNLVAKDLDGGKPLPQLTNPLLSVSRRTLVREKAIEVFDQTFAVTNALTSLALIVAALGLYVAMVALGLNQQFTMKLLNALGVTKRSLDYAAALRALFVGSLACVLAAPLGMLMAWILCYVVNPRGFGWTVQLLMVPSAILVPLGLGLVAALVASRLPTDSVLTSE